jgi:hypothetical protein
MSGISDNHPVNNRGLLDRLVPTFLVITSLVLAFFTGFDIARGRVEWSWFEGAASAVGIAVAAPLTRKARRLYAERAEDGCDGYSAEGDVWSVPLQPYGWTKSVMAVAILLPLASIGFMLTTPA